MRKLFLGLALVAGAALARPAAAHISKFHGDVGFGAVPLYAVGPVNNNPYGFSNLANGYVLKTYDATVALLNVSLGFDAPLYQMSGGEQSLGVALNVMGGLLGTTNPDVQGFNKQLILDFPEYVTYRYGARASKHSQKDFGVGVGLGYRFSRFFLPFSAPSAMLEVACATKDKDYFLRFSGDLRPARFYNDYSSEGLVETLRIRELNLQLGYCF